MFAEGSIAHGPVGGTNFGSRARRLAMRRLFPPNNNASWRLQQFNSALLAFSKRRQQLSSGAGAPLSKENAILERDRDRRFRELTPVLSTAQY